MAWCIWWTHNKHEVAIQARHDGCLGQGENVGLVGQLDTIAPTQFRHAESKHPNAPLKSQQLGRPPTH